MRWLPDREPDRDVDVVWRPLRQTDCENKKARNRYRGSGFLGQCRHVRVSHHAIGPTGHG